MQTAIGAVIPLAHLASYQPTGRADGVRAAADAFDAAFTQNYMFVAYGGDARRRRLRPALAMYPREE